MIKHNVDPVVTICVILLRSFIVIKIPLLQKILPKGSLELLMVKVVKEVASINFCFFADCIVEVQPCSVGLHQAIGAVSKIQWNTVLILCIYLNPNWSARHH